MALRGRYHDKCRMCGVNQRDYWEMLIPAKHGKARRSLAKSGDTG